MSQHFSQSPSFYIILIRITLIPMFIFCFLMHNSLFLSLFHISAIDRAMSPAQSEDSGLAADRGTTYATISIPRENAQAMGIIFTGNELSELPIWMRND